jgi:hypothetical protein
MMMRRESEEGPRADEARLSSLLPSFVFLAFALPPVLCFFQHLP